MVATKTNFESGDIEFNIAPSQDEHTLSLLIEAEKGTKVGLNGLMQLQSLD